MMKGKRFLEHWIVGVMEYWDGKDDGLRKFPNTPLLHYSITPN
jgi:hypothetical protein